MDACHTCVFTSGRSCKGTRRKRRRRRRERARSVDPSIRRGRTWVARPSPNSAYCRGRWRRVTLDSQGSGGRAALTSPHRHHFITSPHRHITSSYGYHAKSHAPTARWRTVCLPAFYVIGPEKAGTTDVFSRISAHPDVFAPKSKEIAFWSLRIFQGT